MVKYTSEKGSKLSGILNAFFISRCLEENSGYVEIRENFAFCVKGTKKSVAA